MSFTKFTHDLEGLLVLAIVVSIVIIFEISQMHLRRVNCSLT